MLQSRRGFLIGAGSLLTTAFVAEAQAFVRKAAMPLLVQPPQTQETLYWCSSEGSNELLLSLDGSPYVMPPPPTWREYLNRVSTFADLYNGPFRPFTIEGFEMWRRYYDIELDQLDLPMDTREWQRNHDFISGPCARAYSLLQSIHFGADLDREPLNQMRPHIKFSGKSTAQSHFRRATASDPVALSLLQARLIDLHLPIRVEKWRG